ncbi:MAG: PorT family protein [Cyclobacteriaceae bacterium]|nr:PorT family protein [Cytophagales bacterium]MBX2900798.1 PorT family protein [Cyclobacteriaceae bacterium]
MKKLLVVALICTGTLTAGAQAQFAVGIKGGPNFAKLDVNSSAGENYKNRTGFHGGAFALIKLTKIGIQPELLFSQQGSKVKFNSGDGEANFNYLNIPVMLKLYTVAGINLQAGPQFGFLTGGEIKQNYQGSTYTEKAKNLYKGSDVSLGLGVGWDLPFGLTIDARYNLGLSKIEDDASLQATKNQVIQLSLGYKLIKLGK